MDLLQMLEAYLASLQSPLLDGFLTHWPRTASRAHGATSPGDAVLPVLARLPILESLAPPASREVVSSLRRHAPRLQWRQTYRTSELDAAFFDNYAWTELVPATAVGGGLQMTAGALLLGPRTEYPAHRHGPEEFYVPLSGAAQWLQGDQVWRLRQPGSVIRHAGDEPHAMRTGAEPLLAVYLWRDADVAQSARLAHHT